MKFALIIIFFSLIGPRDGCKRSDSKSNTVACYQGRLEVKGPCMNYTISMIGRNPDTALVMPAWMDETTGKTYKNVFALNSRCTFPSTINEGDEFYFKIDTTTVQNCMVCLVYYPVPSKKLRIKVLNGPCK
jgi:hypothetical protein